MLEVRVARRLGAFSLDVAFVAPTPGVVSIFGPSGAGKSTILRAIAGLDRAGGTRVVLDGMVLEGEGVRVAPERRRIGVVFQDARLFPHLSVEGNLRFGLRRAPAGEDAVGFATVVGLLGIGALLTRRPHALSGGERQRVAIGRALLSQPRLLLLDEPLASLDAARREEILPYLEMLRDLVRIPIVHVSHDRAEVARLADTLVLIEAGRVVAAGPIGELATRADLPLAGRADAGAVLDAVVAGHEAARRLTRLSCAGFPLLAPLLDAGIGARIRLSIAAGDVALATEAPRAISTHNVLEGRVESIASAGPVATVSVRVGEATLLARVTADAVARLGLAPGVAVFALVKSVSVVRAGNPHPPPLPQAGEGGPAPEARVGEGPSSSP